MCEVGGAGVEQRRAVGCPSPACVQSLVRMRSEASDHYIPFARDKALVQRRPGGRGGGGGGRGELEPLGAAATGTDGDVSPSGHCRGAPARFQLHATVSVACA